MFAWERPVKHLGVQTLPRLVGEARRVAVSEGFRPDIQGLRAIAVGAVVLNHAGIPYVSGGYVGVDVFFVISGFLISTHLLTSLEREGRIRFASFYARRARRILPASLLVLVLSVIGAMIWVPPLLRTQVLKDAVATALYVPNYSFAQQGTDYLAATSTPSLFQHYWSLGVEEQFYVIWPALLAIVWLVARSRRALAVVLSVVVIGSFVCALWLTSADQPWGFFSLWTRAWELGLGGLVALLLRRRARVLPPVAAGIAGWLGLAGIVATCVLFTADTVFPGYAAVAPVAAAGLVILAGATPTRFGPQLLLGARPFQFIGLVSYSLYLVHWPILQLTQAVVGSYHPLPLWATVSLAAASVPVAWLLYRFVENPARRARWLAGVRPRRSLIATGIGTAGVAGLAVVAIMVTNLQPLNAGQPLADTRPSDPPEATSVVASNLTPSLRTAADDNPELYADGCEVGYASSTPHPCTFGTAGGPSIVLFGDSHAAEWFPALQKIVDYNGYQLITQTKGSCASADVELNHDGMPYTACDTWREKVMDQLIANPPDVVVLASYTNPSFVDKSDTSGQWDRGLQRTIDRLSAVTQVVVLADTPDLRQDPSVCLSAHLDSADSCARPASLALKAPGRDATEQATSATGTPLIDLTDYFCTDDSCPPIIGNTLVYRDSHHVTATYSAELARPLAQQLLPAIGDAVDSRAD